MGGIADLSGRDFVFSADIFHKFICQDPVALKRDKWILVCDGTVGKLFYVIFYIFTIGGDNRAVIVIARSLKFLSLIGNTGIENIIYIML